MKSAYFLLIQFFFVLNQINVFSANNDSIKTKSDSLEVKYFYLNTLDKYDFNKKSIISNSVDNFEKYDPFIEKSANTATLGSAGLACRSIIYKPNDVFGFNTGHNAFKLLKYNSSDIKFYQSKIPFSEVFICLGSKREQVFKIIHTQKIAKTIDISVNYRITYGEGYYIRQEANNHNVILTSHYNTSNNLYKIYLAYIYNKIKVSENGGITNDQEFENSQNTDRESIPIKIEKAQNLHKEHDFIVRQFLTIKKSDSASTNTFGYLSHKYEYSKKSLLYTGDDPFSSYDYYNFYDNVYYNNKYTFDTTSIKTYSNQLSWQNFINDVKKNNLLNYSFYVNYQTIKIKQGVLDSNRFICDTTFNQFISGFSIFSNQTKKVNGNINFNIAQKGYNDGDFEFQGSVKYQLSDTLYNDNKGFRAKFGYNYSQPQWFDNLYFSNNFKWNNSFDKTKSLTYGIDYYSDMFSIGVNLYNINGLVYYNNKALPCKLNESASVLNVFLIKNFKINMFGIDNTINYQYTNKNIYLRLPDFCSVHSIYVTHDFFNKVLKARFGIDINYCRSYYADNYMPALQQFYLNNDKKIPEYAYIDVFLTFRIKKARIFLKYQHANAGLTGYKYFTTPHYPMPDRYLKFGVSWKMYN